jgi:hypothetical protein
MMFSGFSFFAKFAVTFIQTEKDKIDGRFSHFLEANNSRTAKEVGEFCQGDGVFKVKFAGKNTNGLFDEDKEYLDKKAIGCVDYVLAKYRELGKTSIVLLGEGDNLEMDLDGKFSPFSKAQFLLIKRCLAQGIPIYFIIAKSEPENRFSAPFVVGWRDALFELSRDFYTNNVFFGIVGNSENNLKAWTTFDNSDLVIFIGTELRTEYKAKMDNGQYVLTTGYSQLSHYRNHGAPFELVSVN